MSKSSSGSPVPTRDFNTVVNIRLDNDDTLGENIQRVSVVIKIVDKVTGEVVKFDPNTIMAHPSGGRIEVSGIVSRDGTGNGVPAGIPSLPDKV